MKVLNAEVIVGAQCGSAVLRGAHVFAPGVLSAPKCKNTHTQNMIAYSVLSTIWYIQNIMDKIYKFCACTFFFFSACLSYEGG